MTSKCPECHGSTTWDDSVGSAVCTSCGTLTDPSQSVLTSQYDSVDGTTSYSGVCGPTVTRRNRFSSSWTLIDQAKEARERRNLLGTLDFIQSLARSLNATGLSPRAMNFFRQAKEALQFRWGKKAKLVAGACLAAALRQSNRPDCLRDIAYLLEEPFPAVSRAFISISSALGLTLSRTDSGAYIPILQQHVSSLLQSASDSLPTTLSQELSSVSLNAVGNTAGSLSNLLARIGAYSVTQYPPSPVACAIFMISLESELRGTIKHLGTVAEFMGTRLNVGKGAVMACYKAIQDALASLVGNVPWLDKYETNKGRAKVAKRSVVARATKDIISFYDDSWKGNKRPTFNIIHEEDPQQETIVDYADEEYNVPRKKRKVQHKGHQAIQFLLDPLTGSLPRSTPSEPLDTTGVHESTPPETNHPLLTYFLSVNATSVRPSRLQLLAATRGGADKISDDELFGTDELENLLRSEEEMKVIADLYGWGEEEDAEDALGAATQVQQNADIPGRQEFTSQNGSQQKGKRSRINLEALAKFLSEDNSEDDEPFTGLLGTEFNDLVDDFESHADDTGNLSDNQNSLASPTLSTDETVIEDWRPPSPGNCISNGRYDEVYD